MRERERRGGLGFIWEAGRRRRQAEAVTVMAMTLVQGWPLHQ